MSETTTERLARFAASLRYDDIPPRVREYCKNMLLDALACAFAGHAGEETGQVTAFARSLASSNESTIIGGGGLSLAGATLLNGYLITAVTMCDAHRSTFSHVTPQTVPPALLIAERDDASGRDLLVALAAGFEVTTRVGIGMDMPSFRARGFHGPGVFGPFGGAAAVGRLRGFSADTMAQSFGLAGSQAAGTFAAWATPTVKFHQCRAALSGLMAALLAEQGFTATREFLTAKDGGLYTSYANGGHPEKVTNGLGNGWELEQIALRLWPSAASIQSMNTALFDALAERPFDMKDVRSARIKLTPTVFDLHGKLPHYKGKFEAMMSAHYTAAAIVADHELTLEQFAPERYDDPALRRAAAELIDIHPDPSLANGQATVEFDLADGTTIVKTCSHARGSNENPLTRAEIEGKLRTYAEQRISADAIERIVGAVAGLEDVKSVRELTKVLRLEGGPG